MGAMKSLQATLDAGRVLPGCGGAPLAAAARCIELAPGRAMRLHLEPGSRLLVRRGSVWLTHTPAAGDLVLEAGATLRGASGVIVVECAAPQVACLDLSRGGMPRRPTAFWPRARQALRARLHAWEEARQRHRAAHLLLHLDAHTRRDIGLPEL